MNVWLHTASLMMQPTGLRIRNFPRSSDPAVGCQDRYRPVARHVGARCTMSPDRSYAGPPHVWSVTGRCDPCRSRSLTGVATFNTDAYRLGEFSAAGGPAQTTECV